MSNDSNWRSNSCKFFLVLCMYLFLFDMTSPIRGNRKIKSRTIVDKNRMLKSSKN